MMRGPHVRRYTSYSIDANKLASSACVDGDKPVLTLRGSATMSTIQTCGLSCVRDMQLASGSDEL